MFSCNGISTFTETEQMKVEVRISVFSNKYAFIYSFDLSGEISSAVDFVVEIPNHKN